MIRQEGRGIVVVVDYEAGIEAEEAAVAPEEPGAEGGLSAKYLLDQSPALAVAEKLTSHSGVAQSLAITVSADFGSKAAGAFADAFAVAMAG